MPATTIVIPEPTPTPDPSPHLITFHDGAIAAADFLAALGLNREWVEVGKVMVAMGLISFIVLCIFLLVLCCVDQTSNTSSNTDNKETGDAQSSAVQDDMGQATNSSSMDDHESESDTDEKTDFKSPV